MVGFGRTGKRFVCEHFGFTPDIMVSGKGFAGGYAPIVGVFFYGGGAGAVRDIVCLGPAFIVSDAELDRMTETLKAAIDKVVSAVK